MHGQNHIKIVYNVEFGNYRLGRYLMKAGRMGWVLAWRGYTTRRLLSVQKHLSFTLEWLCRLLLFLPPMYLELVLLTDVSCHKTGMNLITAPPFSFVFPHPASFNILELDCSYITINFIICLRDIVCYVAAIQYFNGVKFWDFVCAEMNLRSATIFHLYTKPSNIRFSIAQNN